MKKQITLLLSLLLVITSVSAYECQDNTEFWNSPCEIVTPILSEGAGCNALILNINDTKINQSVPISEIGDGTYNFTFNYTDIATYGVTLSCSNYSSTVNVIFGSEEQEPGFNLWLMLFLLFFTLLTLAIYKENHIFLFFSGCVPLLMGIYMFNEGITVYGVGVWWVYPMAWIFTGLGIIITIVSGIKFMEENE